RRAHPRVLLPTGKGMSIWRGRHLAAKQRITQCHKALIDKRRIADAHIHAIPQEQTRVGAGSIRRKPPEAQRTQTALRNGAMQPWPAQRKAQHVATAAQRQQRSSQAQQAEYSREQQEERPPPKARPSRSWQVWYALHPIGRPVFPSGAGAAGSDRSTSS